MAEITDVLDNIESENEDDAKSILHRFLEIAASITGRGEIDDDYTKTISFPIGDITITSDPYYQKVSIDTEDGEEELENEDEIIVLSNEVKRRILQFDKGVKTIREEIAAEIFDKPLKKKVRP